MQSFAPDGPRIRTSGSSDGLRLLCAADIHLGRQPSRVPTELMAELGRELSTSAAWDRLVELALEERVDAVVLAGDVVEHAEDFYEAYSDLERGVSHLTGAGIRVIGVAGNHDVRVLPRLAESVAGFELLGPAGRWESTTVEARGHTVQLIGWSFQSEAANLNPLSLPLPERGSHTVLGVLHCDRDASGSRYAPVRSSDLDSAPVDGWLLGHVHKPDFGGARPSGYLGSIFAADAGEPGARGAWLVEVVGAKIDTQMIPLSPLRWEERIVSADGLSSADEIHTRITASVEELQKGIAGYRYPPVAVGVRLVIEGRSEFGDRLRKELEIAASGQEHFTLGKTSYFINRVRNRVQPAVDLEEMAKSGDPAGLLAARVLLLRGPDSPQRRELLAAARERLGPVVRRSAFIPLDSALPDDAQLAELLEAAALQSLDILLQQREAA